MLRALASLLLSVSWTACAQSTPPPRFDVASIKPTPLDQYDGSSGIPTGHGRLTGNHVTLKRCIVGAYAIGPGQITGGPPWLDTDRFEISAKAEGPAGDDDLMLMLRTLLADRFKLALHRETHMQDALVLETAKGGPKLEKADAGNSVTNGSHGGIDAKASSMSQLANLLSRATGSPVVDRTGLDGVFNFKLSWSPDSDKPVKPGEIPGDTGPSLYTAIQQQLGLRLQARKVPVEVLVIDHAEKPSEN